jgi:uncharacterized membrane protein YphA (DoxX/SURF4 family)
MPILFFRTYHVDARALIAKMQQVSFSPEQSINFRTATMKYLPIGLRLLLTLAFVGAGLAKLAGAEMMIATYDAIGVGQWFRYVTGIIEVGGAILLWLPRRQVLAAALLGGTMVGAVLAHGLYPWCGRRHSHRRTWSDLYRFDLSAPRSD